LSAVQANFPAVSVGVSLDDRFRPSGIQFGFGEGMGAYASISKTGTLPLVTERMVDTYRSATDTPSASDRLSIPLGRDNNRFIPPFPPGGGGGGAANVGGVALRGAGDTLKGLGQLHGLALDGQGLRCSQCRSKTKARGEQLHKGCRENG
jgi:hypothetical protein